MLMANAVDELVKVTAGDTSPIKCGNQRERLGKEAVAIEAFARALRQIPSIIADNAGYDSSDLCSRLRAAHYNGQSVCCC